MTTEDTQNASHLNNVKASSRSVTYVVKRNTVDTEGTIWYCWEKVVKKKTRLKANKFLSKFINCSVVLVTVTLWALRKFPDS